MIRQNQNIRHNPKDKFKHFGLTYADFGPAINLSYRQYKQVSRATYADPAFQQGDKKQRFGSVLYCVCPYCHEKVVHERGVPCRTVKCPKCGKFMVSE